MGLGTPTDALEGDEEDRCTGVSDPDGLGNSPLQDARDDGRRHERKGIFEGSNHFVLDDLQTTTTSTIGSSHARR